MPFNGTQVNWISLAAFKEVRPSLGRFSWNSPKINRITCRYIARNFKQIEEEQAQYGVQCSHIHETLIFLDASSIEFCPTWTTNLQHAGRILLDPSVKYGFGRTRSTPNQKVLIDSKLRSAPTWITGAQVMREVRKEVHLGCWVKQGCRSAAFHETCVCSATFCKQLLRRI